MEKELLIRNMIDLGVQPSDLMVAQFMKYLEELQRWSAVHNLTSLREGRDIILKHFIDSLMYLRAFPTCSAEKGDARWELCDIGTGAGFPGIPVSIVRPDVNVTLIESKWKKTAFLRVMKHLLGLNNVQVIASRVEEVKDALFDIVVTRALFSVEEIVKKAGHILKREGFFLLSKGPRYKNEIRCLQGIKVDVIPVSLPEIKAQRYLIRVKIRQSL